MSHQLVVQKSISIVIPLNNEEPNISLIYQEIKRVMSLLPYKCEIIFVNDGSTDNSDQAVMELVHKDECVRYIELSRNFGKEIATTAGLHHASGNAALVLDADLQHPPEMIPEFFTKWEAGADVVVGIRKGGSKSDSAFKRFGSKSFYKIMNIISDIPTTPHSTDFRLIDRVVLDEFNKISEQNRITRGLIDWLGFKREYVYFDAKERQHGETSYSVMKLVQLAINGFITHSLFPLRFAGYAGVVIMLLSGTLGIVMFIDRYITNWGFNFSGPAILATIILFLVGFILVCIGLLAFYIGNIYYNTRHRPLYAIRKRR